MMTEPTIYLQIEVDRLILQIEFLNGLYYKRVWDKVRNEEMEFEQILPKFGEV